MTALARYSAINVGCPWRGLNVIPTSGYPKATRAAAMYMYGGLTGESATPTTGAGGRVRHYTAYWDPPKKKKQQVDRLIQKHVRLEIEAKAKTDDGSFGNLLRKVLMDLRDVEEKLNQMAYQDSMLAVYIERKKQEEEERIEAEDIKYILRTLH